MDTVIVKGDYKNQYEGYKRHTADITLTDGTVVTICFIEKYIVYGYDAAKNGYGESHRSVFATLEEAEKDWNRCQDLWPSLTKEISMERVTLLLKDPNIIFKGK